VAWHAHLLMLTMVVVLSISFHVWGMVVAGRSMTFFRPIHTYTPSSHLLAGGVFLFGAEPGAAGAVRSNNEDCSTV